MMMIIIITTTTTFINCNWIITRWQWLYTNMERKKK